MGFIRNHMSVFKIIGECIFMHPNKIIFSFTSLTSVLRILINIFFYIYVFSFFTFSLSREVDI